VTKPVIVLGGGGHAKVVVDALRLSGIDIVGIADKNSKVGESIFSDLPVLGGDESVLNYSREEVELVNGLGSFPGYNLRTELFHFFSEKGYRYQTVVHPAAIVSDGVLLQQGVQVMAGAVIQPGAVVGLNSIINSRASVDHDCVIGNSCHVAPGAILSGNVTLGDSVHIGTGAVVIQSIDIENKVVVGAGAVVTSNIPKNSIVYPARSIIKEGESNEP